MNYDKIDASAHDNALDEGEPELADNQIEEIDFLENAVKLYKVFLSDIYPAPVGLKKYHIPNIVEAVIYNNEDINDYISPPEYPDREPS